MKKKEPVKTKWVIAIEKKLKPHKVFFAESRCCGDAWFMDYNYRGTDQSGLSWRIQHNLKSKKLKLILCKDNWRSVHHLNFTSPRQLFLFLNTHFNLPA